MKPCLEKLQMSNRLKSVPPTHGKNREILEWSHNDAILSLTQDAPRPGIEPGPNTHKGAPS